MATQFETIEGRITTMLPQLQSEFAILERIVYKNKNQHRRSSYFQRLLKVRRDIRLLQLANLEDLVTSSFHVIKGDRPKHKIHLLESLKRRKCNDEKHNFLERLLGAARILAEMVEPILKAATYPSAMRYLFCSLDPFLWDFLLVMALLARLRVLVQQVFREFYPVSDDYVTLECIGKSDKYILLERKHNRENERQGEEGSVENLSVQASGVNYNTIESFLGDDQLVQERVEAEAATDLTGATTPIDDVKETVCSGDGEEYLGTTKASFCESSSPKGDLKALSRSKKMAFVSIKNTTTASQNVPSSISVSTTNTKAFDFMGNDSNEAKKDKGDSLASLLTNVNAKDSLF